jgi:hypothetical protein
LWWGDGSVIPGGCLEVKGCGYEWLGAFRNYSFVKVSARYPPTEVRKEIFEQKETKVAKAEKHLFGKTSEWQRLPWRLSSGFLDALDPAIF